jgi:NAD-dependent dihydropyrimidine dehydrogenase PreA subunit
MPLKHKYLKNVTTLALDANKCIGCGLCEMVCPHGVFEMDDGKIYLADKDSCIECGACALNCPTKALSVNPGVGCAAAFIFGWLNGSAPSCDCSPNNSNSTTKCC